MSWRTRREVVYIVTERLFEVIQMMKSIEGVYRDGKIELLETPPGLTVARVIVTFLTGDHMSVLRPAFTPEELAELRGKLAAWEEDWNAPGMEAYDDL
jgi:hypothetical protein